MPTWTTVSVFILGCVVLLCIGRRALGSSTPYPLPPGPPGLPWLGNVLGINPSAPWITFADWSRTYGDIMYSRLMGKHIIIINSEKIAKDLLEKRSKNYSARPYVVTSAMRGLYFNFGPMPYSDRWRMYRGFFHQTFRLASAPRFLPLQHHKACHLLRQLFNTPEQLDDHVFEYTASVILNSTYDYDPASRKDELVDIVATVMNNVMPVWRLEIEMIFSAFPLLLHLPSWFPGMSSKKHLGMARAFSNHYIERAFEHSLRRMMSGSIAPSMVDDALRDFEKKEISPEESWLEALKDASGTLSLAAIETSSSILMTFFLMMVSNPAAQEKAQSQIDAVVGNARLPTIGDRPLLPLVDAIFWETLRYSPVIPLSLPHTAVDDDVYGGFHIPKGAIVLANLLSMAHNEYKYPNPHAFIPERFLNDDGSLKPNDTQHIAFGFGRRMCAGRHFANTSVWVVIAKVLAVFKILKPLDENGMETPVEARFSSGFAVHPLPFGHRIVPRFAGMDIEKLEQLIAASTA